MPISDEARKASQVSLYLGMRDYFRHQGLELPKGEWTKFSFFFKVEDGKVHFRQIQYENLDAVTDDELKKAGDYYEDKERAG